MFSRNDNLAARAKKLQAIKETSQEKSKRIHIKEVKAMVEEPTNHDVQFLIKVNKCCDASQTFSSVVSVVNTTYCTLCD